MDFQSEKSFGKLRLRAFQPYHQIMYIEASTHICMSEAYHQILCMSKMSKMKMGKEHTDTLLSYLS